ncbi:MAG: hypothetical protein NZZ41_04880 [Candidatus Dojkabacteria bacterium]|nr:hypothetical protein [Candidatus Dojkabacteria bacterium]
MPYGIIKVNRAKCLQCKEILISTKENFEVTCSCGKLTISGADGYLERTGKKGIDFQELTIFDFSNIPEEELSFPTEEEIEDIRKKYETE